MAIDAKSPKMFDLVDENVAVEQIGTGFEFTEGPIWNPKEQCLYFSDMPGDIRRRASVLLRTVREQERLLRPNDADGRNLDRETQDPPAGVSQFQVES